MRGLINGLMFSAVLWCAGCATYDKVFVAVHDAIDEARADQTNKPPIVSPIDDKPAIVKPDAPVDPQAILPLDASAYNNGNKTADKGPEIHVHNWHAMNIRIHANSGEFKNAGIPARGQWYPIAKHAWDGHIKWTKTDTGARFEASDFVAPSGQAYRFEGWRGDYNQAKIQKFRVVEITNAQMRGAIFACYSTVKELP